MNQPGQKHVCIVTSAHPWDDVRVASRLTTTFVDAGYRVTWVGPDTTLSVDQDVRIPGVEYRLFEAGQGRVNRLLGATRAARLAREVTDVDWWYSPDPDTAVKLPGLARRLGGRTMFDVHESYHGGLLDRWFPGGRAPKVAREVMRRKIESTCTKMDLVIGVSGPVLAPYCDKQPSTIVVRNLAPASFAAERPTQERPAGARMRFMHGKLMASHGTSPLARAVALTSEEFQRSAEVVMLDVEYTTAAARDEVLEIAAGLSSPALVVQPGVPHDQMADLMSTCSVGLIAYQRDLGHDSLPNRLFEYMAAGLAIVAPSYSPEIVAILEAEGIGLTADFEVPADIARALEWCVEHPDEVAAMGARARAAYLERYTWDTESARLVETVKALETA